MSGRGRREKSGRGRREKSGRERAKGWEVRGRASTG